MSSTAIQTSEPILEPILRRFRLGKVVSWLGPRDKVIDVGCGWNADTVRFVAPQVGSVVGIDKKVHASGLPANARVQTQSFTTGWDVPENHFDSALFLAVIEHLDEADSRHVLTEIRKTLKPGGQLLLTTPTPRGKLVLEFLSYKLGIVSEAEIRDHKIYYDRELLTRRLTETGFEIVAYRTFQLGMNSFCVARK
jgi:cyclopropane fatty-acyl-phospholipid synthase-like methyltransferase